MRHYKIRFSLTDFDQSGEEHYLDTTVTAVTFRSSDPHGDIAKRLAAFVARLLRTKIENIPVHSINIKSCWMTGNVVGNRPQRIPAKTIIDSMIRAGISVKGRDDARIEKPPLRGRFRR